MYNVSLSCYSKYDEITVVRKIIGAKAATIPPQASTLQDPTDPTPATSYETSYWRTARTPPHSSLLFMGSLADQSPAQSDHVLKAANNGQTVLCVLIEDGARTSREHHSVSQIRG